MNEPISYAMRNAEATNTLVYFNNPFSLLDWSHFAIEVVILSGLILALIHAFKFKKEHGSNSALLTLLGCFLYGLTIDILSYYTVENFWHGEFSIMLLYNRLPLYIAFFYPAFMYHAVMVIRRYQFTPLIEAVCTGFFGGFMYLIFDNFGPMVGWWIWDTTDPTTWPYVNSVPLTSYAWFFLFTGAFTYINRFISWDWPAQNAVKPKIIVGHAFQPILTILLGSLLFVPYNLFSKSAPPYTLLPWEANIHLAALVHVIQFSIAGWIFYTHWQRPTMPKDNLLMVFPFIFLAAHSYMYIAKSHLFFNLTESGLTVDGLAIGNINAVLIAIIGSAVILILTNTQQKSE